MLFEWVLGRCSRSGLNRAWLVATAECVECAEAGLGLGPTQVENSRRERTRIDRGLRFSREFSSGFSVRVLGQLKSRPGSVAPPRETVCFRGKRAHIGLYYVWTG